MSHQKDIAREETSRRGHVAGEKLAPHTEMVEPDAAKPEAVSAETKLHRADLAKGIIEYLSKEIETVTNGMMVFRSRISFAVLVGPFLILGALVYAAKGLPISINLGFWGWAATVFVCLCYLELAYISGRIEEDGWRQCNAWRMLIAELQNDPMIKIGTSNLRKDKHGVDPVDWMWRSYVIACALMLVSFGCLLFILSRVQTTTSVTQPPAIYLTIPQETSSGAGTVKPQP